ncbi:tetratricopeptide repeat protein [Streptomyces sp. NBC_00510]
MRLFGPRGRHEADRPTSSPVDEVIALYTAGRYAEAETEARAVAAAWTGRRGTPYAPLALSFAALAAGAQGRHAEAVTAYDDLLPVFGRTFGAEHMLTLKLRSDRAQALSALGRHAECEAECRAVAGVAARGTGPDMLNTAAAARNGLVFALTAQGRHAEAEALVRDALAAHPEHDRFALVLRLGLARSLNAQARHEEALAEAERADDLRRGMSAEQHRAETGAVELALATALQGLGREREAHSGAVTAHDACLAMFGPDHRRTVEARDLLERIAGDVPDTDAR